MTEQLPQGQGHLTVRDVADAAGVSTSTAARALSGRGYVAAQTRERVSEAAEQLGYVPNAVARSLRSRSTRVIGVLITDIGNPFYAEVADGVEQVLRSRGYQVLLADSDGGRAEVEAAAVRTFQSMRVDGLIITPAVSSPDSVGRLAQSGTIVVEIDNAANDGYCDSVVIDNERGSYQATRHLLELGHRRIGLILGETSYTSGLGRLDGYRAALLEIGLKMDESLVAHASYHPSDARGTANALLDRHPDMTAIFATNGLLALGALQALRERRQRIPQDTSLVAFDEAAWMEIATPGITTVAQPSTDMGREAAALLLDRLAGDLTGRPVMHRLPARFVRRESTGPPRSVA